MHLLVKIKPTIAVADFVRDLKANSSREAKTIVHVKFGWARRYGAFTVSESQFDVVRKYIQRQEDHHRKFDFKEEYESLLKVNGIPIDDYIWQE